MDTGLATMLAYEGGFPGIVSCFLLVSFVYVPLLVEFVLPYVGLRGLRPRRLASNSAGATIPTPGSR